MKTSPNISGRYVSGRYIASVLYSHLYSEVNHGTSPWSRFEPLFLKILISEISSCLTSNVPWISSMVKYRGSQGNRGVERDHNDTFQKCAHFRWIKNVTKRPVARNTYGEIHRECSGEDWAIDSGELRKCNEDHNLLRLCYTSQLVYQRMRMCWARMYSYEPKTRTSLIRSPNSYREVPNTNSNLRELFDNFICSTYILQQ